MKHPAFFLYILLILLLPTALRAESVIRINQLGYLPEASKTAVFLSDSPINLAQFELYNSLTDEKVFDAKPVAADASIWGKKAAFRLDFSSFTQTGGYYLKAGANQSPSFRIDHNVYDGTADFILNYMRQQRCGFNPYLKDSCHLHDGIIVDHPTRSDEHIDVTGGWHDASDYLQYVTTSANATYQMLFAYHQNPTAFGDAYQANGLPGKNGIPDILDEARWGLEWLLKMNPAKNEMYNQIADDRDHRGYRLPNKDTVSYGLGKSRPVYFVTGKPQGLGSHKNRSTGVASTAAKYASAFALGAKLFQANDPGFASTLSSKASDAWEFAQSDPGVCQTACVVSPYFYEEGNYLDDMELAAASLQEMTGEESFSKQASYWGNLEPVSPWMELHRARHYQYYPFVNLGHAWLAQSNNPQTSEQFKAFLKQGLEDLKRYAGDDPFLIGVPFVWCSNNFVVAATTQARLYRQITGDTSFLKMEAALTDWLLGCNPWGTSMICGLPAGGDYPAKPHSSITVELGETTNGGLVDGPVYQHIYNSLRGIQLLEADEYANYQGGKAVYHDDIGDYSSNEPTMDGTASLSFLLSSLEAEGQQQADKLPIKDSEGALIRMNPSNKEVYLIFSAHDLNNGGKTILNTLNKHQAQASFFFTGDFYAQPSNKQLIRKLIAAGHYLGAHSDKHLLYADWSKRDSLLVSRTQFEADLKSNYQKMKDWGIEASTAPFFLPPYEWYNQAVTDWAHQMGLKLINFTPGIRTNADYTTPNMPNYRSSEQIIKELKSFEKEDPHGLNGAIVLIHLGAEDKRPDKLFDRLDEILIFLNEKGYKPSRLR
ncbi:glycoside hydrolase family 9 protein [Sunxiuqinia elliptica]|uniref:Peptidoglycan/xylan/chitin deacetylase, PgdA/CDA1 family n=1 Tax=Sunxiuqinia elliptica TaxID=655355 RepID=A0A1I2AYY4_9BACT|nr:glycoside hydrolase family 9 protein [Sunxiuqinia elliptica]SFE49036.1 Peptidoglycan/xylan/chitin deacetylase, PgdA/CDA1 family [Sunxiuqinia elliptica]